MPTTNPTPVESALDSGEHISVTYSIEEYLPYENRWVTAHGGLESQEAAEREKTRWQNKQPTPDEHFRITKTVTVATVAVVG